MNVKSVTDNKVHLNQFRHYYLYAKGHYFYSDRISDLQKIQSDYTGSSPESIKLNDILSVLKEIIVEQFKYNHTGLEKFYSAVVEKSFRFIPNQYTTEPRLASNAIIDAVILLMLNAKRHDIDGELGEPDPNILPLDR